MAGVKAEVKRAGFSLDFRLKLEPGFARSTDVAQPVNPAHRSTAAPEALAIVAGMPGTLVEADHLRRWMAIGIRPVALHVVNADEQVNESIRIPVDGRHLDDLSMVDSQVQARPESNSRAERRL